MKIASLFILKFMIKELVLRNKNGMKISTYVHPWIVFSNLRYFIAVHEIIREITTAFIWSIIQDFAINVSTLSRGYCIVIVELHDETYRIPKRRPRLSQMQFRLEKLVESLYYNLKHLASHEISFHIILWHHFCTEYTIKFDIRTML